MFLDTNPDRHGFGEWSGNFSTQKKCEQALKREQAHWYDMSPDQPDPDKPDIHVHGQDTSWVRGLPGFCESSDKLETPGPWSVLVPPGRCEDKTRNDIDICKQVPNPEAPLSAWFRTLPTYRTAQDCEKVLDEQRRDIELSPDRARQERELAAERCVRSDTPKAK
jgi:hypothetical protein